MELHCLPTETPTTVSSCSTDPPYDNCPPFAQRGRARGGGKEMESRVVCPAVTGLPGPRSPPPGPAPAVAEVPTLAGGGRGPGAWPDHSYCSWAGGLGRRGWEAEQRPGVSGGAGGRGGGGERGGERGGSWGDEDGARPDQSPAPSHGEQHRSALSVYDNLPDTDAADATPHSLQEAVDMETGLRENGQEAMYQAWAPEHLQGLTEGDEASTWSSCEIILADGGSTNQDQDQDQDLDLDPDPDQDEEHEREPELDSGSSAGFQRGERTPRRLRTGSPPQPSPGAERRAPWPPAATAAAAGARHPQQRPWSPRVPPPVPLADPSASALRSILTGLQQQIVRQREEYEERIVSLEQRNEELQVEVVRLKTNLAQQRHWYQAVQVKIAETERARAAAEQRNATLQRELEQFFDTFGELNNEAKKTEYIVKSF